MSLTSQLISGSVQVLNLIKNYIENPRISADLTEGWAGYPIADPFTTVVILGSTFHEIGDDDISTQLIVNEGTGGKTWVSDNIAPKPRMWELRGYIGPSPLAEIATVVNGIPLGELATPLIQSDLQASKRKLRDMRNSRQVLVFQTPNGEELVWVGMKHLDIEKDPLIQNQIPVVMTLQEMPLLQFNTGGLAGIPSGSANVSADPVAQGVATGLQVANFASILTAAGL